MAWDRKGCIIQGHYIQEIKAFCLFSQTKQSPKRYSAIPNLSLPPKHYSFSKYRSEQQIWKGGIYLSHKVNSFRFESSEACPAFVLLLSLTEATLQSLERQLQPPEDTGQSRAKKKHWPPSHPRVKQGGSKETSQSIFHSRKKNSTTIQSPYLIQLYSHTHATMMIGLVWKEKINLTEK